MTLLVSMGAFAQGNGIGFGVISASVLVWSTFRMNTKYGEWGLMKIQALHSHPRYLINWRKFLNRKS